MANRTPAIDTPRVFGLKQLQRLAEETRSRLSQLDSAVDAAQRSAQAIVSSQDTTEMQRQLTQLSLLQRSLSASVAQLQIQVNASTSTGTAPTFILIEQSDDDDDNYYWPPPA